MSLTEREAASALDLLQSTSSTLESLLAGLTQEQWRFRPSDDVWTIAEITAHLIAVEELTVKRIETALASPDSPPELLRETEGKESRLLRFVPDRARRVKVPPDMDAAPPPPTPQDGYGRFALARTAAITLLSRNGLKRHAFAHFAFGQMTLYQWLLMLALHCRRHCTQAEELKSHGAYPMVR